jgi:hypothetical protein
MMKALLITALLLTVGCVKSTPVPAPTPEKLASICGPQPILEVRPNDEKKPLEEAKYLPLVQGEASFPMSSELSGKFKEEKATAVLHFPALMCIINEHSKAYLPPVATVETAPKLGEGK